MFSLQEYEYFEDLNLGLTKYTPHNKKILDVACGLGTLGEYYRKQSNEVIGIDKAAEVKGIATKRLNKFYAQDLTQFKKISKLLKKERFDIIVFADILEHIYDPIATVNFYKQFTKPNSLIYISVPNFVVWYTRLEILSGNFTYASAGTSEKTHIRIFTLNNLKLLAKYTNLEIVKLDITPGIARFFVAHFRKFFKKRGKTFDRTAIMNSKIYAFYIKYVYPLEYYICKLWPGMLAFQYIAILKKKRN